MLKRLDRSSAVKPVLEQFRDAIESGQWPSGSKIPTETELMDMLGVGRGVVREALATIKAFGLIDSRPGLGTYVTSTPSELVTWIVAIGSDNRELLEARYGIDAWINYLAAQKATPEEVELISDLAIRMETAVAENKTRDEIVAIDGELHTAMAKATHNSVLARLSVIMAASLEHNRRTNISTTDLLNEAIHSHRELAEAIRNHDPHGAWVATRQSLQRVACMQDINFDDFEVDVEDEKMAV
jgi:DNA-binding FadR family transcriptional regulator